MVTIHRWAAQIALHTRQPTARMQHIICRCLLDKSAASTDTKQAHHHFRTYTGMQHRSGIRVQEHVLPS